ncbi:polysulfide reductase NrfD [Halorubrum luteum]
MATKTQRTSASERGQELRLAWYALLIGLLALGVYGGYLRFTQGLASTNLTSTVPWGAWVAFYIYFVGLSAGAFLVSTLANVFEVDGMHAIEREALFVAVVSMLVALTFVWIDLGRMDRLWHPFVWRQSFSVLSWEVHAYVLYIAVLAGEVYFSMREDLVAVSEANDGLKGWIAGLLTLGRTATDEETVAADRVWVKRLGFVGIPLAIVFVHGGTGNLFAVAAARDYWFSALFPVIFITSAVVSGMALIVLLYVVRSWLSHRDLDVSLLERLAALFAGFIVLDASLKILEAFVGLYSLHPGEISAWMTIMTGEMWWSFWIVMVGMGWVLPLALLSRREWRQRPAFVGIAGLSGVLGVVGTRFNIVVPAQIEPSLYGLATGAYVPSAPEWALSIGIIAFGALLYTVGAELLPLVPQGDHNE